ncbi:TPA: ribulose-phosphate 3-epimerase [Candidatus Sumerlaeota bacterium]|nr:ribulose-phosphate 3-epimerase [Candidatus Sumerlaeota bacterium]
MIGLAPSILSANFANLESDLKRMMRAKCFWTHLDVMDGHFVPNITFGPPLVKSVRGVSPRLFLDAHLMVSKPLDFVERFADAGADLITFHAESVENMHTVISAIRGAGCKVGVSIKPKTPIRSIEAILGKVDLVLVMTVEPGFGGQELMPSALNKVRQLAQARQKNKWNYLIQVDGGINIKTVGLATAAGANILVAGTAVFGGEKDSITTNVQQMLQAAMTMPV